MSGVQLPEPIQRFVDATNSGDTEAFVSLFTEDAYLNDWGREFHGRAGVRSWNETDNIGVDSHFEVLGVRSGDEPDTYIATLRVSGNGYNGTGPLAFTLAGSHIASLRIS